MLTSLINKIFPSTKLPEWSAVEHQVIRDEELKSKIDSIGYAIAKQLNERQIKALKALYEKTHNFQLSKGGMFYSVYSEDLEYRKKVHHEIGIIMKDVYDELFTDYKVVLNSFIIKVNGPDSEFGLHQDSTGLDETKYSPLSVWIPLQDTTVDNGCLSVVPTSHSWFSPYRGISFPEPFREIEDEIRHYLQPINLKAGEVLLFDNRLVHYSPPNYSDKERIVVMSGIFPKEAEMISCYKDMSVKNSPIEIFRQEDDHLLTFKNFFHSCTCRPETGEHIDNIDYSIVSINKKDLQHLAKIHQVPRVSHPVLTKKHLSNIVSEPIQQP